MATVFIHSMAAFFSAKCVGVCVIVLSFYRSSTFYCCCIRRNIPNHLCRRCLWKCKATVQPRRSQCVRELPAAQRQALRSPLLSPRRPSPQPKAASDLGSWGAHGVPTSSAYSCCQVCFVEASTVVTISSECACTNRSSVRPLAL